MEKINYCILGANLLPAISCRTKSEIMAEVKRRAELPWILAYNTKTNSVICHNMEADTLNEAKVYFSPKNAESIDLTFDEAERV